MSDQPTTLLRQSDERLAVVLSWIPGWCESGCSAPAVIREGGAVLCDECAEAMAMTTKEAK